MSSVVKTNRFKYLKNLVIGLGASVVLVGALFKILSWPYADLMLTIGLLTEAFLFAILGIIPPEKDYYWEKLYPGLDNYSSNINPITAGPAAKGARPLDSDKVESNLEGMLSEMQAMAKSLGSLRALQEVDFSKTGEQMKTMGNFYERMAEAMVELNHTVEGTKEYKTNLDSMNQNLTGLNTVYSEMFSKSDEQFKAMSNLYDRMANAANELGGTVEDTKKYRENLESLNKSLSGLSNVYGNMLSAMSNIGGPR